MYYPKSDYDHIGFEKSNRKNKKYNAIIKHKQTNKIVKVPFGSLQHENFKDSTGLNLYPNLIHGDIERRRKYRARHIVYLKEGYYSPSFYSWTYLW